MSQRSARRSSFRRAALVAVLALAAGPVVLTGAAHAPASHRSHFATAAETATTTAETGHAVVETATTAAGTATTPADCTIVGGTLTWGFKESFRSYISGTIAKGAWEPTAGATYETPNFGWSGATGGFDPATLAGDVQYAGGVRFTGHNGLLDTTIANPTLRFAGDGSGVLLLDLTSLSMDDAMAGNTQNVQTLAQVPIVSLDLAAAPLVASDDGITVTGTAVPTTMTAEGYAAFGSYEAGTAFDPATFSFSVECPEPEPTPEATTEAVPSADPTPVAASADEPADLVWVAWAGVAVVALAILGAIIAVRSRGRGAPNTEARDTDGDDTDRDGTA